MMHLKVVGFLKDEMGATAIEYGLIAALIAVVAIASFAAFGSNLGNLFNYTSGSATNVWNNAH
jgi:pilus assembly protein Flp/PilA